MVSGFVTSPEDQSRICLLEASPIRIASKSLISIKFSAAPLFTLDFEICHFACERAHLGVRLLLRRLSGRQLDVREVVERLVGGERELPGLVDALLPLLQLLRGRLARGRAEGPGRQVDAELLCRPQELVLLLAYLDLLALVREDVDV